jgi:DNA-binding GntR family transcriptional regulator
VTCVYTAPHTASTPEPSLTSAAYDALKRRLLHGEFRIGHRLAEVALADELGVSRTPVREALARLHAEGFVVRLPEGGYSPAAPDLHTIAELYVVRRGLEFTALHEPEHDPGALRALHDDWLAFDPQPSAPDPDFVLHDEDFHIRLAESSGNRSLAEILTRVSERIRIVRIQDFLSADRIRKTIAEHLSIVEAMLADDRELADRRLNRHLAISRRVVERRAAHALTRMIHGGRDD